MAVASWKFNISGIQNRLAAAGFGISEMHRHRRRGMFITKFYYPTHAHRPPFPSGSPRPPRAGPALSTRVVMKRAALCRTKTRTMPNGGASLQRSAS